MCISQKEKKNHIHKLYKLLKLVEEKNYLFSRHKFSNGNAKYNTAFRSKRKKRERNGNDIEKRVASWEKNHLILLARICITTNGFRVYSVYDVKMTVFCSFVRVP